MEKLNMSENVRFVKLVSGENVIGVLEDGVIKDLVMVQAVPAGGGMQIAILPYGFPFEEDVRGEIKEEHIMFEFDKLPEELLNKYIESKSDIKIASPGMGGMGGGAQQGGSGIIL